MGQHSNLFRQREAIARQRGAASSGELMRLRNKDPSATETVGLCNLGGERHRDNNRKSGVNRVA